jgi:hypothetical protein
MNRIVKRNEAYPNLYQPFEIRGALRREQLNTLVLGLKLDPRGPVEVRLDNLLGPILMVLGLEMKRFRKEL